MLFNRAFYAAVIGMTLSTSVLVISSATNIIANESQSRQSVEQMLTQVKGIVNRFPPGTASGGAASEFSNIISGYFQIDSIAMSIMGRHWTAFKGKESQFYDILRRRLASVAADHFQKYFGYDFKVVRSSGNSVYVSLTKGNETASGLNVSIQVNNAGKVEEVSFEGITIINALSSDWQSFFVNQCQSSADQFLSSVR